MLLLLLPGGGEEVHWAHGVRRGGLDVLLVGRGQSVRGTASISETIMNAESDTLG